MKSTRFKLWIGIIINLYSIILMAGFVNTNQLQKDIRLDRIVNSERHETLNKDLFREKDRIIELAKVDTVNHYIKISIHKIS